MREIPPYKEKNTMQRSKPYTLPVATLDIIMTCGTAGFWLIVVFAREMYRFFGPR